MSAAPAASKDLRAQTAFQLLYWGRLRRCEVLALRPMDFDFKNDSVKIDHSYTRLKKQDIISDPKTAKSKRIVTLPHAVMELVQRYMDSIYHLKSSDRIFQSITHHALRKAMSRYQQEAGIKYIRLHDLRHSHASLLIERGYSPLLIAQHLGHENIETTLRTYAHLYPHKNEDLMADLNSLQKCYDSATPHKTARKKEPAPVSKPQFQTTSAVFLYLFRLLQIYTIIPTRQIGIIISPSEGFRSLKMPFFRG